MSFSTAIGDLDFLPQHPDREDAILQNLTRINQVEFGVVCMVRHLEANQIERPEQPVRKGGK